MVYQRESQPSQTTRFVANIVRQDGTHSPNAQWVCPQGGVYL